MKESASTKKFWGKVFGGTVTVAGLVASVFGIASGVIPLIPGRDSVEGTWTLKTQTEKTTATRFKDMELTYTVNLTCDGAHVTGKGHKLGEKLAGGTFTPYEGRARTSIDIEGNLDMDGDLLEAVLTEDGEQRNTSGHLELKKTGRSWMGTFNSEAATSSGTASLSRSSE